MFFMPLFDEAYKIAARQIDPRVAIGIWIFLGVLVLLLSVVGLVYAIRWQKQQNFRNYQLHITNLGNLPCRYALHVEEPLRSLEFKFVYDGVELQPVQKEKPFQPRPSPSIVSAPAMQPSSRQNEYRAQAPGRSRPVNPNLQVGSSLNQGKALVRLAATFGNLIPGSLGASLRRWSMKMSYTQSKAARLGHMPQEMGRLVPGKPKTKTTSPKAQFSDQQSTPSGPRVSRRMYSTEQISQEPQVTWVQTPILAPGTTALIGLQVKPNKAFQSQQALFRVDSRAISDTSKRMESQEEHIILKGLSLWQWVWPYVAFVVIPLIFEYVAWTYIQYWQYLLSFAQR